MFELAPCIFEPLKDVFALTLRCDVSNKLYVGGDFCLVSRSLHRAVRGLATENECNRFVPMTGEGVPFFEESLVPSFSSLDDGLS